MARVTVEDCLSKLQNRFELVALAAQRAKELNAGAKPLLDRDNDKDSVIALREIAGELLNIDTLRERLTQKYMKISGAMAGEVEQVADTASEVMLELEEGTQNQESQLLSTMYRDETDITEEGE